VHNSILSVLQGAATLYDYSGNQPKNVWRQSVLEIPQIEWPCLAHHKGEDYLYPLRFWNWSW